MSSGDTDHIEMMESGIKKSEIVAQPSESEDDDRDRVSLAEKMVPYDAAEPGPADDSMNDAADDTVDESAGDTTAADETMDEIGVVKNNKYSKMGFMAAVTPLVFRNKKKIEHMKTVSENCDKEVNHATSTPCELGNEITACIFKYAPELHLKA